MGVLGLAGNDSGVGVDTVAAVLCDTGPLRVAVQYQYGSIHDRI